MTVWVGETLAGARTLLATWLLRRVVTRLKIQRVGGLEEACRIYARAVEGHVRLWAGTMPETMPGRSGRWLPVPLPRLPPLRGRLF